VDQRYFDGQRFHRVVPNFVVQAGDPRGDGWGGPGGALRDELNPRRYEAYTVGMALSGPDTGGSQWFITLSQQPHLDGGYTVFGEVKEGVPALLRVTQGDLIRSIRR
jgi:cyclophilin family peptidyl-prolyl cis-trans isomerase